MTEVIQGNTGSIKIHNKVLAEITCSAVSDVKDVFLPQEGFLGNLGEFFGTNTYSGVCVSLDKNNRVSIEVKIKVNYGVNIPDIARQVQEAVRNAIEKTVDIDLKDVNVNIQGIERRSQ